MGEKADMWPQLFVGQEPFVSTVSRHSCMGRHNSGPRTPEAKVRREDRRREVLLIVESRGRIGCDCQGHFRCVCDLGQGAETRPSKVATGLGAETRPSSRLEGPIGGEVTPDGTSTDGTEAARGNQGGAPAGNERQGRSRSRSNAARSSNSQSEPCYYWQGRFASKAGERRG